jgi:hypothetical protein
MRDVVGSGYVDDYYYDLSADFLGMAEYAVEQERRRLATLVDERCLAERHTDGNGVCLECHDISKLVGDSR